MSQQRSLWLLIMFISVSLVGCKKRRAESVVANYSSDDTLFENADYSQGIVKALAPSEGDPDYVEEQGSIDQDLAATDFRTVPDVESATAPAVVFGDESLDNQTAFALTGPYRLRLDVVIGNEVIDDLMNSVSQEMTYGRQTNDQSVQKLKETARRIMQDFNSMSVLANTRTQIRFMYSYNYLANEVRRRFVDPQVYAYRGIFSRIIHRRYSRGRGIVWRKVQGILHSKLAQFEAMARSELRQMSTSNISLEIYRHGSCGTATRSYIAAYGNNQLIGRTVYYTELKSLYEQLKPYAEAGADSGVSDNLDEMAIRP